MNKTALRNGGILIVAGAVILVGGFSLRNRTQQPDNYVNKEIPTMLQFKDEQPIPEKWLVKSGYKSIAEKDTMSIAKRDLRCEASGKNAEIIEYFRHNTPGATGAWSFRYAAVCGDEYLIADANGAGWHLFGPFFLKPVLSYVVSPVDATTYCDGAKMDSEGYRKTITVEKTTSTPAENPTKAQLVKATILAATTGMCNTVMGQATITEKNGTIFIPPIGAWAGVSITMCSCRPIVETNVLRIPGVTKVVWQ